MVAASKRRKLNKRSDVNNVHIVQNQNFISSIPKSNAARCNSRIPQTNDPILSQTKSAESDYVIQPQVAQSRITPVQSAFQSHLANINVTNLFQHQPINVTQPLLSQSCIQNTFQAQLPATNGQPLCPSQPVMRNLIQPELTPSYFQQQQNHPFPSNIFNSENFLQTFPRQSVPQLHQQSQILTNFNTLQPGMVPGYIQGPKIVAQPNQSQLPSNNCWYL